MRIHIGLVPIYALVTQLTVHIGRSRSSYQQRNQAFGHEDKMRTISRHTGSTPQIRLTTKDAGAARPQALTISVKAHSRHRMCGQELPLPNK